MVRCTHNTSTYFLAIQPHLAHVLVIFLFLATPTTASVPCSNSDVRLQDGSNEREGRIEICMNGQWGTICNNLWDDQDATVVCRQLGFSDQGMTLQTS